MTPRPALSTPRPLPRKREHAKKRPAIALAGVNGTSMQSDCNGLTPAKAFRRTLRRSRGENLSRQTKPWRVPAKAGSRGSTPFASRSAR